MAMNPCVPNRTRVITALMVAINFAMAMPTALLSPSGYVRKGRGEGWQELSVLVVLRVVRFTPGDSGVALETHKGTGNSFSS